MAPKVNKKKGNQQPQPKAKPRAKPPAVPRPVSTSSAFAYLNPEFHRRSPASAISLGKFTTINSRTSMSGNTSTTLYDFICVQWTPSGLASWGWSYDGASAVGQFIGRRYLSYLDPGVSAVSPVSIKPLRSAVSIRNFTQDTNVSGVVKVLIISDPIEWGFITNQADVVPSLAVCSSIFAMMNTHPSVRSFTGKELQKTHLFVQGPASYVGYNQYLNFNQNASTDAANGASIQTALIAGADAAAMQTVIFMIPPSNVAESYEFTVHRQDGCRYVANQLLASTAECQDHASVEFLHRTHTVVSEVQSDRPTAAHEALRAFIKSGGSTAGSMLTTAAISAAGKVVGAATRSYRGKNWRGPSSMG